MDRRGFLKAGLLGCSAAASPFLTPVSLASAPWDARLVVIVLRGAMDGMDAVQPWGAPEFAGYRPGIPRPGEADGPIDLDGYFAMHGAFAPLKPLWDKGELGFVHAVSTPYRNKRSHFDGQDILEAGVAGAGQPIRDGWLNRMLQTVPGIEADTAYAVGRADMLLLRGDAPVANWAPGAEIGGWSPQSMRLLERIMHDDPLFRDALEEAEMLSAEAGMAEEPDAAENAMMGGGMMGGGMAGGIAGGMTGAPGMAATMGKQPKPNGDAAGVAAIARYAGERLRGDSRIAAFSINGWDTHAAQRVGFPRALGRLTAAIEALKESTGPAVWGKTAVVVMTEFGRTARMNGTSGTDHGTGGVMILAGGAVRGGRVAGKWPGIADADLFEQRDLMPTEDVRSHAAWTMRRLFGLPREVLEAAIFPGLKMGEDPKLIL